MKIVIRSPKSQVFFIMNFSATAPMEKSEHPKAVILARGSTPSRTRLYQMGISQFLDEIDNIFHVNGFKNGAWQPFERGRNFEAFFIVKK